MRKITVSQLPGEVSNSLGLPPSASLVSLIKASLRRAAFILAPADRADLIRFVTRPLSPLGEMSESVEHALDELVVYGDILEMHRLPSDPWHAPSIVLRPAPPTFVRLQGGDFAILGAAGDHSTALTSELYSRLEDHGPVRRLLEIPGEDLRRHLGLLGFVELSEQAWLRTPAAEPAATLVSRWQSTLLKSAAIHEDVEGLEIIDLASPVQYYKGRWKVPKPAHTGFFVGRRRQPYGGPIWSFVALEKGVLYHIIDIFADDDRQRPCDLAWRLQAALDASSGTPQIFKVHTGRTRSSIDFYSPLPAFAERKLGLVGEKSKPPDCLFRFEMPNNRLEAEAAALAKSLWMRRLHSEDNP